ncbi:MAG: DinB family protein [bacterium]
MKRVLKRLDRVHEKLNATLAPLNEDLFTRQPADGGWSVAQILQHLRLVEERVTKDLEKGIERRGARVRLLKRLIPTSIVALRLVRVKAPKAVNPLEAPDKQTAIENLNRARSNLKKLCADHGDCFRQVIFKHPFLGEIDGVATISFVGYHEQRHYKQIREVLRNLAADSRG